MRKSFVSFVALLLIACGGAGSTGSTADAPGDDNNNPGGVVGPTGSVIVQSKTTADTTRVILSRSELGWTFEYDEDSGNMVPVLTQLAPEVLDIQNIAPNGTATFNLLEPGDGYRVEVITAKNDSPSAGVRRVLDYGRSEIFAVNSGNNAPAITMDRTLITPTFTVPATVTRIPSTTFDVQVALPSLLASNWELTSPVARTSTATSVSLDVSATAASYAYQGKFYLSSALLDGNAATSWVLLYPDAAEEEAAIVTTFQEPGTVVVTIP